MLVDDEPNVLSGYARTLRKHFKITTCTSGAEALDVASKNGPFAVVVSDMRMPEMNGVELLSRLKKMQPHTVRMMLTGNSDQQTAIDAVNQGDVFRFMNKPCSPKAMAESLQAGIRQYRLIHAEKELLEKTVKGSVNVLSEVLSLTKPDIFGRTNRYKSNMLACAKQLDIEIDWTLETIALLSLIGTVSFSDAIVEKALSGGVLSDNDSKAFHNHPIIGADVLSKIPRMEAVAKSIRYQRKNFDGSGEPKDDVKGAEIPIGARLLRVVTEMDSLEQSGMQIQDVLNMMSTKNHIYDPDIVNALIKIHSCNDNSNVREVNVYQLTDNMELAQDVITESGTLLIAKGQMLSPSAKERLINFSKNGVIKEVVVVKLLKE